MYKTQSIFFVLMLVFLMSACGQSSSQGATESTELPYRLEGVLPASPVAQEWITEAVNDLAEKQNVNVADVTFVVFKLPVWPDGSYGCPQPDQTYDLESKEGYQIQLRVNGRDYFYHGGEDIEQFLCESE